MKKRVVIKLGGSSLGNPSVLGELASAVHGYRKRGQDVVLVHGGGPAINQELTQRGIEWTFINGQRRTTPEMMEVIELVLAGEVNRAVVNALRKSEVPALGLSGAGDLILGCTQLNTELMQVGSVAYVDTAAIDAALSRGFVPVIAPIGFGADNTKYNINADWAATKTAIALGARKLIFLTDQNGILDGEKKLVKSARPAQIFKMIEAGVISGGMYTKVSAMITALESGVEQVRVLNAAVASQILGRFKIGTLLRGDLATAQKAVLHEHAS